MRTSWLIFVACSSLVVGVVGAVGVGCGGGGESDKSGNPQCSDGIDNDGDGMVDFPDDLGCASENGSNEGAAPSPQCSDGRDNDNDGKIDFPNDPGCLLPQQDSETDDCPDGPNCPQCSNNKDDDGNGLIDFPDDPGCTSAADADEFLDNPAACGNDVMFKQVTFDGHVTGSVDPNSISHLSSPTCGGGGGEQVYELRIMRPTVVTAATNLAGTNFDTVLYVRPSTCADATTELTCNDDFAGSTVHGASSLAVSITTPGVYYLVVDSHDAGIGGTYDMQINFLAGEGEPCTANNGCGTGLVCRVPLGMTDMVCSKHICEDGVDDDGDGKLDYPTDPGCASPTDDDETDTCPGAGCPACSDGIDNDGDGQTDYPNDSNCDSAAGLFESCVDTDPVGDIVGPSTAGTTVGLHNDTSQSCGSTVTRTAPEKSYKLHVPMKLDMLTISTLSPSFNAVTAAYGPSCGGTALACQDSNPIVLTNLLAGDIYVVVDGYSSGSGTFTLGVQGRIKNGESCEGALVTAGVLACGPTAACTGTAGMKTCVPAQCSDGVDNNGDGTIDYPTDPGCDSPADDSETTVCPGASCPVCSDGVDNDTDGHTDYATDLSCWAASGTNESFCNAGVETDRSMVVASAVTLGDTTGLHNDQPSQSCQSTSTGNDVAFSLTLPVPVTTIQIDTIGSTFDTVLSLRNTTCATEIACNDDGSSLQSLITQTSLAAGNYAIIVDGFSAHSGPFQLNVRGKVANGTVCTSPLFASGVLACTGAATCTGGTCH